MPACARWCATLTSSIAKSRALHAPRLRERRLCLADRRTTQNSVFAWIRHAPGAPPVAVIANMTPVRARSTGVPLPADGTWKEMVNSDALLYGGSGLGNLGTVDRRRTARAPLTLPPLATIMLELG